MSDAIPKPPIMKKKEKEQKTEKTEKKKKEKEEKTRAEPKKIA